MKNKNICFMNSYKFWGGGEKSYFQYGKYLASRGYEIYYIIDKESKLYEKTSNENWAKVFTVKTGNSCQFNIFLFIKMIFFLFNKKIDVIFLNTHKDWKAVGIPAKLLRVKKVIYTKGTSDSVGMSSTRKFYFDNVITDILVKSEDSKNNLYKTDYRLMKDKIVVLKNGLDLTKLNFENEELLYKKDFEEIILGVSSRLEDVKRISDLIDVVNILKIKNRKKIKLLIAGTGSLESTLKEKIEKFNLEKEVEMVGFQNKIEPFLKSIDIFLFPSEMEGLSNSILEAMAFSLPIVSYRISSMPELVENNYNGFLVNPFDIEEFSEKVLNLIEDDELRKKMGRNSKKRTIEEFNMEKVIDRYEELINS